MEDGLGVPSLSAEFLGALHVSPDLGEGGKIVVYELSRLAVIDVHTLGQTVGADAVDDAKVGLLGLFALFGSHFAYGDMPYLGCSGCVYVSACPESFEHVLVL